MKRKTFSITATALVDLFETGGTFVDSDGQHIITVERGFPSDTRITGYGVDPEHGVITLTVESETFIDDDPLVVSLERRSIKGVSRPAAFDLKRHGEGGS